MQGLFVPDGMSIRAIESGILLTLLCCPAYAQTSTSVKTATAQPEMARLAQALAGDWNNVEVMEPSGEYPHGAQRRGTSHCELSTGGVTLICRGSSDGSAGQLDHLVVMWWDTETKLYGFFICFRDRDSGCEIRGTAHWDGKDLVNDYKENVNGKQTKMRDSWIDITPRSHTLIAAMEMPDGSMKPLITTRSTKR